ncbi:MULTISPECIES: YgaP family membrane protein [Qipengyuania]|uniref:DUF2892 domain-containing protein n=1 Tax=Qipengyuania soli TaxID=2782568 RepID=A0A7S8IV23_9SPHN|nr:DUF2892 domain-containing protein [Qipengyuania soli]QPC98401.1 DUF2892 domain-containing protein [Qipengyuania soli]
MVKNMGSIDRTLRLIVAVVLAYLLLTGTISGTLAIVAGAVAAIFVLTSIVGFCPLYKPLGLSTCRN